MSCTSASLGSASEGVGRGGEEVLTELGGGGEETELADGGGVEEAGVTEGEGGVVPGMMGREVVAGAEIGVTEGGAVEVGMEE
jgi:hypothetical protein